MRSAQPRQLATWTPVASNVTGIGSVTKSPSSSGISGETLALWASLGATEHRAYHTLREDADADRVTSLSIGFRPIRSIYCLHGPRWVIQGRHRSRPRRFGRDRRAVHVGRLQAMTVRTGHRPAQRRTLTAMQTPVPTLEDAVERLTPKAGDLTTFGAS